MTSLVAASVSPAHAAVPDLLIGALPVFAGRHRNELNCTRHTEISRANGCAGQWLWQRAFEMLWAIAFFSKYRITIFPKTSGCGR